jgi:hypothetical protein
LDDCIQKSKKRKTKVGENEDGDETDVVSTESESDGEGALRKVREEGVLKAGSIRRGPKSNTLSHWHEPVKIAEPGKSQKRWKFVCKYCAVCVVIMFLNRLWLTYFQITYASMRGWL